MTDTSSSAGMAAPREGAALEFAYQSWKLLPQLVVFAFCAALILVAAIDGEGRGSAGARLGISLIGLWGLLYAIRRVKSPRRIAVGRKSVSAGYWIGPDRTWMLDDLNIRAPTPGSFWESSVIVELRSGEKVFRVYRDLPGFERLRRLIAK